MDADSRVAGLGQTFGEILLDENAASHIALGYGFPALVPESSRQNANSSDHHLDVMIGAPSVDVTGLAQDGSQYPLLRDGRWSDDASCAPHGEPSLLGAGRSRAAPRRGHRSRMLTGKIA